MLAQMCNSRMQSCDLQTTGVLKLDCLHHACIAETEPDVLADMLPSICAKSTIFREHSDIQGRIPISNQHAVVRTTSSVALMNKRSTESSELFLMHVALAV